MKTVLLAISILLIFSGLAFAQTTPRTDESSSVSVRSLNHDDDSPSLSARQSKPRSEATRTNDSSSSASASRFGYTLHRVEYGSASATPDSGTSAQPARAPTTSRTSS
jgi:hypothetical protein